MSPCGGCVVTTNCMKCGNFFSLSFVVISKSSNSTSMLYTALALLSVSIHDTHPVFSFDHCHDLALQV